MLAKRPIVGAPETFALVLGSTRTLESHRFWVHPGSIPGSELQKHIQIAAGVLNSQGEPIRDLSKNIKTVEQGAATSVWCATSHQLDGRGGVYCENCDIAVLSDEDAPLDLEDSRRRFGVMPYAINTEAADRLWKLSEGLLGMEGAVRFNCSILRSGFGP